MVFLSGTESAYAFPMPNLLLPIHPTRGALLDVRVVAPSRTEILRALVDTGAERSSIDREQADMLGLEHVSRADVVTPSTGPEPKSVMVRRATLVLVADRFECKIPGVPLLEAELENQGFTLLLGRDILSRFHIHWDGPAKRMTLFL
jgi:predicted aspartyl protease